MIRAEFTLMSAVRLAGIGTGLTGFEFAAILPNLATWSLAGARNNHKLVVGMWRVVALAVGAAGCAFAVEPRLCLDGGGLIAGIVIATLMVAYAPVGDGADAMLVLVLVGLGTVRFMPARWLREAELCLLAAEVCLAYWGSGAEKLRVAAWRAGRQVAVIVNCVRYGSAGISWQFLEHPSLARAASWGTIGLEVSAPIFLILGGWPLLGWAICIIAMHLAIAVVMGLGRFVWAFGAGLMMMVAARNGL